jgi:hypothetical protein
MAQNSASDQSAKKNSHAFAVFEIALAIIAIPISMWATLHSATSVNSRASGSDTAPITGKAPTLNPKFTGNTISCKLGELCSGSFEALGTNLTDKLTLDINFLPPGLAQNTCETATFVNKAGLNCSFSGTPTKAGEFKLLVAVANQTGATTEKVINLNIH